MKRESGYDYACMLEIEINAVPTMGAESENVAVLVYGTLHRK